MFHWFEILNSYFQHLVLENDYCISRNVGKLKMFKVNFDYVKFSLFYNLNNDVNISLLYSSIIKIKWCFSPYFGLSQENDLFQIFSSIRTEQHFPLICTVLYFNKSSLSVETDAFSVFSRTEATISVWGRLLFTVFSPKILLSLY